MKKWHSDRSVVHRRLLVELTEAARHRHLRAGMVEGPVGPEPAWAEYERGRMHALVNGERRTRGFPPIAAVDVAKAEQLALGHADYASKYALHCTCLAVEP